MKHETPLPAHVPGESFLESEISLMPGMFLRLLCLLLVSLSGISVAAVGGEPDSISETEGAAAGPRFDIFEYRIEGNSVLDRAEVERAVYRFLGPKRTIEDVNAAKEALEAAYRDSGYLTVYVDIPEQKVDQGVVVLKVTEGRIERVKVTGSRYYSLGQIRSRAPSIAEGQVPYFPQVQKELAGLSHGQDRVVTPVLKPGSAPGTLQVELKVKDQNPLHGGVELNNRQTPNTSEWRMIGYLRYDNLFQRDHSVALQYQVTPLDTSEISVVSGTYLLGVPGTSHLLALYAVHSNNDIAAVGDVRVLGNANIFGARYIVPVRGTDTLSHYFTFGLDRKDYGENVRLVGADDLSNPISYSPVSLAYSASLAGKKGTTRISLTANTAIRNFLGNTDEEFQRRRSSARANYMALRGEVQREQKLPRNAVLLAKVGGQTASQPLISSESFFAGGLDSVRGYLEAERVGDTAVYGTIELRAPPPDRAGGRPHRRIHHVRVRRRRHGTRAPAAAATGGQVRPAERRPGAEASCLECVHGDSRRRGALHGWRRDAQARAPHHREGGLRLLSRHHEKRSPERPRFGDCKHEYPCPREDSQPSRIERPPQVARR